MLKNSSIYSLIITLFFSVLTNVSVWAQDAATIFSKQGTVEIKRSGQQAWDQADVGTKLADQDSVRTSAASRVALLLNDGVMVRLNQRSVFRVKLDASKNPEVLALDSGDAHFFSRKSKEFPSIKAPLVSASIRGTEFTVSASANDARIAVFGGAVEASNSFGRVNLSGGEEANVKAGGPPVKSLLVNPTDAVQWALYYPSFINVSDLSDFVSGASATQKQGIQYIQSNDLDSAWNSFRGNDWRDGVGKALVMSARGNSDGALPELAKYNTTSSPSYNLLLSSLYLERGQVAEAKAVQSVAEKGIAKLPQAEQADLRLLLLSQQAIIDIVQNRKGDGLAKAEAAYQLAPDSATAALALSYVMQSDFDLVRAREIIENALKHSPNDIALRVRHADLLLSFGDGAGALEEATFAANHMPQNSAAHTTRGFALLAQLEPEAAADAFKTAIAQSSGDGMPFLGLGLAEVRLGSLSEGRIRIQQAADLEPTRSLFRSYLGKALFEEEKEGLADEEYDRAITLDPNDPTPYLYRSYNRLSENRPVEALEDVEKSIELNDNRAVYRSRLLLDQDTSIRTNSLAGVYDQLGFSQLSKVEAIKSLSRDYSNYSAHLQLSQSYDGVDDLIQASLSEFYTARLLAPVNFNLVRPSQGGQINANEYTAVFDRDINRTTVSTIANTQDKSGAPGLLFSGTSGDWGYAMSYNAVFANGYRDDDSANEQRIYSSLQYQATPADTFLIDFNGETFDDGDTEVGYDPNFNDPDVNQKFDDFFVRGGFNHRFSAGSQLIGQFVYNHSNYRQHDDSFDRLLFGYFVEGDEVVDSADINAMLDQHIQFKSHGVRGDLQHLYNSHFISNIFGGGILDSDQNMDDDGDVIDPEELAGINVNSVAGNNEGAQRVYNYTIFHAFDWLDLTAGVSYAHLHLSGAPLAIPFSEETNSRTAWDPKVGFVITPPTGTTFRAAYFETTGTAGIREFEMIEPTIISGFNQTFFDIYPGTQARNFAVGIDQKFASKTYIGAEGIHRSLKRDFPQTVSTIYLDNTDLSYQGQDIFVQDDDAYIDEDILKGYAYQVLHRTTTATVDYLWNRDKDNFYDSEAKTQRVRTGINYFDSSGFLAFTRGTWRDQRLTGFYEYDENGAALTNDFWILDVGAGYRIPNRHGQIVLTLTNLLDEDFYYLPSGIDPLVLPGFGANLTFSYNF